jgi:hypothetical protein
MKFLDIAASEISPSPPRRRTRSNSCAALPGRGNWGSSPDGLPLSM